MFNVTRSALLLLCSVMYVSAADQKYTVFCTENFEGKEYNYSVKIKSNKITDAAYVKKAIKPRRHHALFYHAGVWLDAVRAEAKDNGCDEGSYDAINNRISSFDVDLEPLKAGMHEVQAIVKRKRWLWN